MLLYLREMALPLVKWVPEDALSLADYVLDPEACNEQYRLKCVYTRVIDILYAL